MLMKVIDENGEEKMVSIPGSSTIIIHSSMNCNGHCIDCHVVDVCSKIDKAVYGSADEVQCSGHCMMCTQVSGCMKIKRAISVGNSQ